ncbi:MAG: hypothetical protein HYU37_04970 [Acidobacteria bacterium]|nr:hypothetical protein [Acidobacteriota bacterium]
MAEFLWYWLRWPSVEAALSNSWAWPLCETLHFIGLALLVGIVGMFDLRLMGMAKGVAVAPLRRLLPWAVVGFVLCVITGLAFVLGIGANLRGVHPYTVAVTNVFLQLKLLFVFLAGLNLLAFYLTGMSRTVELLGPGEDAPLLAKVIAGVSLTLWIGVVWLGRLVPWGLTPETGL